MEVEDGLDPPVFVDPDPAEEPEVPELPEVLLPDWEAEVLAVELGCPLLVGVEFKLPAQPVTTRAAPTSAEAKNKDEDVDEDVVGIWDLLILLLLQNRDGQ